MWKMDSAGHFSNNEYGPFPGWSTVALSRFAPGAGDGGGALTGAAGGDLFGLYPNPTIAANAVDHTKLASDAASLAQVSGGLLASPDGIHVDVKNDLIVYGTVIALKGSGGAARALVDNGAAGLVINYAHDFGNLDIQSDTYIPGSTSIFGSLTSVGNIITQGTIFDV